MEAQEEVPLGEIALLLCGHWDGGVRCEMWVRVWCDVRCEMWCGVM